MNLVGLFKKQFYFFRVRVQMKDQKENQRNTRKIKKINKIRYKVQIL